MPSRMRVCICRVDAKIHALSPRTHRAVVADDYQIMLTGDAEAIAEQLVEIDGTINDAFRELSLPVARAKLAVLASSAASVRVIAKRAPHLSVAVVSSSRNLGIDFTLKKKRRVTTF